LLTSFVPIAIFLVVAIIFGLAPLIIARFLAPHRPNPVKLEPYESGVVTIGRTHVQFRTRYYLYALVFVVFDVEAVFLFPWAVAYYGLGIVALVEMAIFMALLLMAYAYAWKKGALEWL